MSTIAFFFSIKFFMSFSIEKKIMFNVIITEPTLIKVTGITKPHVLINIL